MFDECDVVQKGALGKIGGHNKKFYQIVTGQLVTRVTKTSEIRLLFMISSNFGASKR